MASHPVLAQRQSKSPHPRPDIERIRNEMHKRVPALRNSLWEAWRHIGHVFELHLSVAGRPANAPDDRGGSDANADDGTHSEFPAGSESETDLKSLIGYLGSAALADVLGIPESRRNAFKQRLMRERDKLGDDCWHEVVDPRPNSPRYLYRVDSPEVKRLAEGYQAERRY